MAHSVPTPIGPEGVLIFRGNTLAIGDLTISIDDEGQTQSSMALQVAWEVWPMWIRVAIDHEFSARVARTKLLTLDRPEDGPQRANALAEETRAGLVAITASAFAVEAMAISAASKAGLPAGIGVKASSARRIAEVLKQCFVLPPERFAEWRDALILLFKLRNLAVHPDSGLNDPRPHPALNAGVPMPAHLYRAENVNGSLDIALFTAATCARNPKQRLGKKFRQATNSWVGYVEELHDLRKSQQ